MAVSQSTGIWHIVEWAGSLCKHTRFTMWKPENDDEFKYFNILSFPIAFAFMNISFCHNCVFTTWNEFLCSVLENHWNHSNYLMNFEYPLYNGVGDN